MLGNEINYEVPSPKNGSSSNNYNPAILYLFIEMELMRMTNEDVFNIRVWDNSKLQMIMPKTVWLQCETPIPASSLIFDDKFTEDKLHDVELDDFNSFIAAIPTPSTTKNVTAIILSSMANILQSRGLLAESEGMCKLQANALMWSCGEL